jgi:dGTPase
MTTRKFSDARMNRKNPKWEKCVSRINKLYHREKDMRSEFERDYNRILHCTAFRRLKHKTQVFFSTRNDHVCTRIEHVNHVSSVSYSIAKILGLNTELTMAIATGHDLGHPPFGHSGESILKKITQREFSESFWHEKNSLRIVDKIETLENSEGKSENLNLTYAIRDGIILHCGEVNENSIYPRDNYFNIENIEKPGEYQPYTWEGCIVKIADKISYLGRDIQDALRINILTKIQLNELKKIAGIKPVDINNAMLIHNFVSDLCANSSIDSGICFSEKQLDLMNKVKEFNYRNIYFHPRLINYGHYSELIINSIFDVLKECYTTNVLKSIHRHEKYYPLLCTSFTDWLMKYSDLNKRNNKNNIFENEILYHLDDKKAYYEAIIDYIASMTDNFAIEVFNQLTRF